MRKRVLGDALENFRGSRASVTGSYAMPSHQVIAMDTCMRAAGWIDMGREALVVGSAAGPSFLGARRHSCVRVNALQAGVTGRFASAAFSPDRPPYGRVPQA